jgi:hypothetical protein
MPTEGSVFDGFTSIIYPKRLKTKKEKLKLCH